MGAASVAGRSGGARRVGAIVSDWPGLAEALAPLLTVAEASADGPLDALVVSAPHAPLAFNEVNADNWADRLSAEFEEVFQVLRSGLPRLSASGSVVVIAPPAEAHEALDARRQGLRLLVRAAALELGPEGVRVNLILPAADATAEDVAAAVDFAASPRAAFMTGADIPVGAPERGR